AGTPPDTRAVIFAERIATLKYLERTLPKALKLPPQAFGLLHGGLTDMEQQEIVEEFKRGNSPLRVLITGDVASEGVNLHSQCHVLVHFDIPWSLIRIEQRNGRIDRYGQHNPPDISTLLLQPSSEKFSGDLRVLTKLMEKEHAAHKILPDVASIMGKNSVEAEERAIAKVLAEQRPLDDAVPPTDDFDFFDFLDAPIDSATTQAPPAPRVRERGGMFATDLDFLQEALAEAFGDPHEKVDWRVADGVASLTPPPDLARRLAFLPRDYLRERRVTERLQLATTPVVGESALRTAQQQEDTNWPAAHFLGPLHPVLDWASDRALASLSHNEVLAVRGPVDQPTYLLLGTITNQRGQIITRSFMQVADGFCTPLGHVGAELISASNPGPVDVTGLDCAQAVTAGENYLRMVAATIKEAPLQALERWLERAERWDEEAGALVQRSELRERRDQVAKEHELATQMKPAQQLVRPLLVIVPEDS
ncbi:MAG: helicase-related protein, partial [Bowdeniella nasicola]|nr:helicase-related protein [Bowdeniella nasicola]